MAVELTTAVDRSVNVRQVEATLSSRAAIADPEQYVKDNTDGIYDRIIATAGLPAATIFVAVVLLRQNTIGGTYTYVLLLTLDEAFFTATAHEHTSATLHHPLVDAYRDGPAITLDPTLGPVDILGAPGSISFLRVTNEDRTATYLDITQDGYFNLGGHVKFTVDQTYDIGTFDGVKYYRPRDVYVGRDLYAACNGYFGISAKSPEYLFFPELVNPDTDPASRHIYWNSTVNEPYAWDGITEYSLVGGGGGPDADGVIFIEDLTPNVGNIDVTFAENDTRVVSAAASPDVTTITTHVFAYTGHLQVRPTVLVNGSPAVWSTTPQKDPTAYEGTVDVSGFTLPLTLTAVHQDGNSHSVVVTQDAKPVISTLEFTGGYPGSQTELKAVDTFNINVQTDLNFVEVEVEDSGACDAMSFVVGSTTNYTFAANIADRGTSTQALPARVRVKRASGTWSDWVYTNAGAGTVDGTDLVNLNNLYPSVEAMSQVSITYPVTQEAIKDSETVTVHSTCSDFDTIAYSSPTSELTIPATTTYVENKSGVARNSGGYNITTVNYQITATRVANNAVTTESLVVYIAHDSVQIQMTEPAARLRTGGNDGTSAQDHTITMTANQWLVSTPTIAAPPAGGGTWQGAGFAGGPTVWTRALQCHDNDTVGAYSYGSLVATNLANRVTTAYTGDSNYTIGGFVSRVLSLAAFANQTNFTAAVADYSKCTLVWAVKSLPNKRAFNTAATPDPNSWCFAGTLGVSPTTARILDTAATGSSSNVTNVTVEEVV